MGGRTTQAANHGEGGDGAVTRGAIIRLVGAMLLVALPPAVVALRSAATAEAQPSGMAVRVGRLHPGSPTSPRTQANLGVFRAGLRELGWIEGRNLVIEHRYAEGKPERLAALADDLARSKVDVIVAVGNPGISAAQQATATIPIVMAASSDPVRFGFVQNLARPEGNITGLSLESQDLHGKRLELLKEAVSGLRKVAIVSNPSHPGHADFIRESEVAARALGIKMLVLKAGRTDSVEGMVRAAIQANAGALLVLSDPLMLDDAGPRISALALKQRLPTLFAWRHLAEGGGFISYGANLDAMTRRSAFYVDRLLKGAKPGGLPVEQPTTFELVVNLKTATALGLTISPSLGLRVDRVVE